MRPPGSTTLLGTRRSFEFVCDDAGMLLWVFPHGPLDGGMGYQVELEADHQGVRILVARDEQSIPHGIAVAVGDDPSDFADTLAMWGLASTDDSGEPPREWFA